VIAMDQTNLDAYAVFNWLVRYYEGRGMVKQSTDIREQLDRLGDRLDRVRTSDTVFEIEDEYLEA
jgi:hypothetical protein